MSTLKKFNRSVHGQREIILDVKTTGALTADGHRIVEVAAIELRNHRATGREFYALVNPERDIPQDIAKVIGINDDKVKSQAPFATIAKQLAEFIGPDPVLIIGRNKDNYPVDMAFVNMELSQAGLPLIPEAQSINLRCWSEILFGEKNASLDKVLDKYGITRKDFAESGHGAIADARLLSIIYPRLLKDYKNKSGGKATTAIAAAKDQNNPPTI